MTEKDKLIELLDFMTHNTESRLVVERMADYLLANGVTIPVRCEECKYGEKDIEIIGYRCGRTIAWRMGNDFCSRGERRADNGA